MGTPVVERSLRGRQGGSPENGFEEVVFADDLNDFKSYPAGTDDQTLQSDMQECQENLHKWGRANQVAFDPSKESKHILATCGRGSGGPFTLLGVAFDPRLTMGDAVHDLVANTSWKVASIQRAGRYFTTCELIHLYKSRVLSFVECRTPAIYHACDSHLRRLDAIQTRFLKDTGIDEKTALECFNLAPLEARRDMAMLGLIHRTVLGRGPPHFNKFFKPSTRLVHRQGTRSQTARHSKQLEDVRTGTFLEITRRFAFGLIAVYNILPQQIVDAENVSDFQSALQTLLKSRAMTGRIDWRSTFSPRMPMYRHPLLS